MDSRYQPATLPAIPMLRRRFIRSSLLGLATAPLVAKALTTPKASTITPAQFAALDAKVGEWMRPVIMVPANRMRIAKTSSTMPDHAYIGPWRGTFKPDPECTNPAYILAHLLVLEGQHIEVLDWRRLYAFGQWCDELVVETDSSNLIPYGGGTVWGPSMRWVPRVQYTGDITPDNRALVKEAFTTMMDCWGAPSEGFQKDLHTNTMIALYKHAGLSMA